MKNEMELLRIITTEGITVYAKEFEIYSVVGCSDGLDYIVESINGKKIWNLYDNNDDEKYNNFIENELPKLENPNKEEPQAIASPIKNRKPKIIADIPIIIEKLVEKPEVIQKKKGRPFKNTIPIDNPNIETECIQQKKILTKKIIKFKEIQLSTDKKLSEYHTFIRNFLSQNSDIVWNERMKEANTAWKIAKETA